MTEEEYIKTRLDDQINWLSKRSGFNQMMYKRLILLEIILSVSIPFLTSFIDGEFFGEPSDNTTIKILIGFFGLGIALIAGIMNIYKFQENWVNYRATAETLKQEKFMFITKSGKYQDVNTTNQVYNDFVANVEKILAGENSKWKEHTSEKVDGDGTSGID